MYHRFIYNGKNSRDLGLVLSGEDVWKTAVPDLEFTSIPGHNGDLLISNNRYKQELDNGRDRISTIDYSPVKPKR